MSIGPFDINAGAYGKLDFSDPFGDTTADIAPVVQKAVAPKTIAPVVPSAPVAQKPVQGNVGISPITMQGAVSIPAEPTTSTYGKTNASYFGGTGPSTATIDSNASLVDALTGLQNTASKIRSSTLSSFDPGNRMPGFGNTSDYITSKQADIYADYFKQNPADLIRTNDKGDIEILNLGTGNDYTLLNTLGKLGYDQELIETLDEGKWQGKPKIGEYYTFKADQPDAFEKYALPALTAAITIANPVAGAAWAAGQAKINGGDLGDIAKAAAGAYIGGQAAAGNNMFAGVGQALSPNNAILASGISSGVASGVSTAVQGGDLGDVVKSGMLGGVGGYVSGLGTEAASLEQAAQAANAAGDISSAASLAAQANELTQQAGLIGTIANSAKAIDAAIDGDYVSALTSGLNAAGTDLTKFTSDKITGLFGEEALVNLNVDDIAAGVNKVATSLLDGKDFDDALKEGVKEYIQEGGSLGGAGDKVKDYLVSAGEGLYNDIIKPAGDFLTGLVDNVQSFDTPESIKAIEDVVKQAGSAIDDTVLQPIKEVAEAIYEPIETPESIKAIEDAARTAGSAVDDAVIQPIRETLKDIDLPSVSAPNINIDLSGMFDALMAYLPSQQQQRQPVMTQQPIDPVLADLSKYQVEFAQPEEMLASRDYLSGLLRTI